MLESSINYIIMRTFPESLILILSGMILLDLKINIKKLVKQSILLGICVVLIRILPINFGVHTVLSMIALGIMLFKIYSKDILKICISICEIFISIILSEGIYVFLMTFILNIPTEILMNNTSIKGALITLPSLAITFIIVLIFKKINTKIYKSLIKENI